MRTPALIDTTRYPDWMFTISERLATAPGYAITIPFDTVKDAEATRRKFYALRRSLLQPQNAHIIRDVCPRIMKLEATVVETNEGVGLRLRDFDLFTTEIFNKIEFTLPQDTSPLGAPAKFDQTAEPQLTNEQLIERMYGKRTPD